MVVHKCILHITIILNFLCSWCSFIINLITIWVTILGSPAQEFVLRCAHIAGQYKMSSNYRCTEGMQGKCSFHVFNISFIFKDNIDLMCYVNIWIEKTSKCFLLNSRPGTRWLLDLQNIHFKECVHAQCQCVYLLFIRKISWQDAEWPCAFTGTPNLPQCLNYWGNGTYIFDLQVFGICSTVWNCLEI